MNKNHKTALCVVMMAMVVVLLAIPISAAEPITTNGWVIELNNFVPSSPLEYNLTTIQYNGGNLRFDDFYITEVVILVTNENGTCYKLSSESAYSNSNLNRIVTPYGWIESGGGHMTCTNIDESVALVGDAGTMIRIYYKNGSINPYGAGVVTFTPYATNFNETVGSMLEQSYELGYNNGYQSGLNTDNQMAFNEGYATAIGELEDGEFASNFLGDALFAPIKAINDFQLFTLPGGTAVTLGGLFFTGLALCLIFLVLRYFAGG